MRPLFGQVHESIAVALMNRRAAKVRPGLIQMRAVVDIADLEPENRVRIQGHTKSEIKAARVEIKARSRRQYTRSIGNKIRTTRDCAFKRLSEGKGTGADQSCGQKFR